MGYNARNDEIDANLERMRREREAVRLGASVIGFEWGRSKIMFATL